MSTLVSAGDSHIQDAFAEQIYDYVIVGKTTVLNPVLILVKIGDGRRGNSWLGPGIIVGEMRICAAFKPEVRPLTISLRLSSDNTITVGVIEAGIKKEDDLILTPGTVIWRDIYTVLCIRLTYVPIRLYRTKYGQSVFFSLCISDHV